MCGVLGRIVEERGAPRSVRSHNGPEFVAGALKQWLSATGTLALYIEPGSPWQNRYIESFNAKLRDELLAMEFFDSLAEAIVLVEAFGVTYSKRIDADLVDWSKVPEAEK